MQDTGIHYVEYDAGVLWQKMLEAYVEAGGDILYPGSEKEILLRAVQLIIILQLAEIDGGLRQALLRYAIDDKLKEYGENRRCPYISATKATATVTITFRASGATQTIRAGEPVTADGVMLYTLDDDVEDTGTARTVTARVTCSKAGAAGNGLLAGTQMQFLLQHNGVTSVVCATDAKNGQDDEDQEKYRERIRTKEMSSVTTGTTESYRSAAMAVSSVIVDAKAMRDEHTDGLVRVYLLLSDNTGASAIIAAVADALSDRSVRPLTDNRTVELATAVPYSLSVHYEAPDDAAISNDVAEAIQNYLTWQNGCIGRAFDPDMLKTYMHEAGARHVVFDASSRFNGSASIVYTQIGNNEVCSGTVMAEVSGT